MLSEAREIIMPIDIGEALTRMEAGQAEARSGQEAVLRALDGQGDLLRTIVERLGLIGGGHANSRSPA